MSIVDFNIDMDKYLGERAGKSTEIIEVHKKAPPLSIYKRILGLFHQCNEEGKKEERKKKKKRWQFDFIQIKTYNDTKIYEAEKKSRQEKKALEEENKLKEILDSEEKLTEHE